MTMPEITIGMDALSEYTQYTPGVPRDIVLRIRLHRRTKDGDFEILIPTGIRFRPEDVLVDVMGRGFVPITELAQKSPGRYAQGFSRPVGKGTVRFNLNGSHCLMLWDLDLRADNGTDVVIRIRNATFARQGSYKIMVSADVSRDGIMHLWQTALKLQAVSTVTDFTRVIPETKLFDPDMDHRAAAFRWTPPKDAEAVYLMHSDDGGNVWKALRKLSPEAGSVQLDGLAEGKEHWFKLDVVGGARAGFSNIAKCYGGMYNVCTAGKAPTDGSDAAPAIDRAIRYISGLGGGTILFEGGVFCTTTVHLQSNVWLFLRESAEIRALPGCDNEEKVWFSDEEYRSDQSHMSDAPYRSPGNWMTKQDAGHSYFRNALFYGERLTNVKIVGNGRLSGGGNLTKSNQVMELPDGCRADKMIALKLCSNVEIGGLSVGKDLWYKQTDRPNEDQPFYLESDGRDASCGIGNMLRVSDGGHFVLLATGCDGISAHDVYAEKGPVVRDIFDFMGCSDVQAFNVYAQGAPDDVIKLGSDCSLGFTRPSRNFIVRNIIGDTACNLFQIGSETADDIQDVCIDNLYVLASNKAGFSVSVNDGGHIRNVHLNCGGSLGRCRCGVEHEGLDIGYQPEKEQPYPSVMRRVRTPFFISLSNRGRTLGAHAMAKKFTDDTGVPREELMVTNVNIGRIENVLLRNLDIREVYAASQAKSETASRWPAYDGQPRTTAMIVGYKIPEDAQITTPDGSADRDIENVVLEDMTLIVKGGNPPEDAANTPRELGVGQFNLRNLAEDDRGSKIPAYGLYARHVGGLKLKNCSFGFEEADGRHGIVCDDVKNLTTENLTVTASERNPVTVKRI